FEKRVREQAVDIAYAAEAPRMAQESLLDYHLYTLDRTTSILENQTKQVALLQADNIASAKEYILQGQDYYYRNRYGDLGSKIRSPYTSPLKTEKRRTSACPCQKASSGSTSRTAAVRFSLSVKTA
ncbi:MAG: hypothetical protein WBD61_12860, partial [Desulfobulbales bacterium]